MKSKTPFCTEYMKSRHRFTRTTLTCWLLEDHMGAHYDYDFGVYWYDAGYPPGIVPVGDKPDKPVASVGRVLSFPRVAGPVPIAA